MRLAYRLLAALAAGFVGLAPLSAADALEAPVVERAASGQIDIRWQGADPVDVYVATAPDAPISAARRVAVGDRDGVYVLTWSDPARPYFILRDDRDGSLTRVAERLLPLERGSNFRDLGGYPAADGKHVRWGMIYRTAATPMLTDDDFHYVERLGIRSDIDLRSVEERQLAPDELPERTGARYFANDYPADTIFSNLSPPNPSAPTASQAGPGGAPGASSGVSIVQLYRQWPISLASQYREIFRGLLRGDGAVSYHCSAGQDRTGVATALVLSALGVPRDVILADYHLSTLDRRPQNEMPPIDPAKYPGNPVAAYYARARASGAPSTPKPLYDSAGVPYLQQTFDEIDQRWGSVDNYLDQVLGVTKSDIARLRAMYLE